MLMPRDPRLKLPISKRWPGCFRHTFEVAPAFVTVERYMVEKMLGLVGYENGDGLFFAGQFLLIGKRNVASLFQKHVRRGVHFHRR